MLSIKEGFNWRRGDWHVGETVPRITESVVTFQADGHELEVLLLGMKYAYMDEHGRIQMGPSVPCNKFHEDEP